MVNSDLAPRSNGDFLALLKEAGHPFAVRALGRPVDLAGAARGLAETHGTTVIAVKYKDGVLNVGDRRATANNAIIYDRAEKIISLDDHSLIGISGSYARSLEVIRFLRSSFKYYARTQLQEMSLDGKLNELSRIIAQNFPSAMQGFGAFIPILSAYDLDRREGRIFFYDAMGARFETDEFAAAGSGSERIRGSFDYIVRTKGLFRNMALDQAIIEALVLLDIAADLDSATGGYAKILPVAKTVSLDGVNEIPEADIRRAVEEVNRGIVT
ncbi:MAG TPA: proteasome subunit alpha [Armatimonadota bacterium]|nr:proteasome subunit alpha [Armatimonadota bacterium]